jgi:hypothetical protein
MNRTKLYVSIMNWSAPILLVLVWIQIITGLGNFRGKLLQAVTLGILDPGTAGKIHTVVMPLVIGVVAYGHAILGLQIMARRLKWVKKKDAWEIGIFVVGALLLLQFLVLYFG